MITKVQEELIKFSGYERGIRSEQERVIEILQALPKEFNRKDEAERLVAVAIRRIRSEDI